MKKNTESNYALRRAFLSLEHAITSRPLKIHHATINERELELCEPGPAQSTAATVEPGTAPTGNPIEIPNAMARLAAWCESHGAQFGESPTKGHLVVTYTPAKVATPSETAV